MAFTSDEKRREVVAMLRAEAKSWRYYREDDDVFCMNDCEFTEAVLEDFGFDDADMPAYEVFNLMADIVDRQTCRNVSGCQDVFECSECRCKVELIAEVCNEHGEPFHVPLMPSFCPNCGAEVIDD